MQKTTAGDILPAGRTNYLSTSGENSTGSFPFAVRFVSSAGLLTCLSFSGSAGAVPPLIGDSWFVSGVEGVVGDSAPFSLSFASSPSTRFRRASSTSVFGPRFLGTASGSGDMWVSDFSVLDTSCSEAEDPNVRHTINTGTLEDLACLARRTEAVALDLQFQ